FYRVGTSFGNDSVWCVNTFRDITDRKNDQVAELRHTAATTPQLPPICPNEEILNVLDDYNYKHHPNVLGTVLWTPREASWNHPYQAGVALCLDPGSQNLVMEYAIIKKVPVTKDSQQQRFYRPEGMMPKYTGHIPHERSGLGRTFGNICRSCSVCSHTDKNYGAYLSKKRKMEKGQEQIKENKETLIA
ncbi:hypothetical protein E2320_008595, partial [Naja naja]